MSPEFRTGPKVWDEKFLDRNSGDAPQEDDIYDVSLEDDIDRTSQEDDANKKLQYNLDHDNLEGDYEIENYIFND
ncbi:hypothetical protein I4U23_027616 [Adineta vaga]|nr:hypothetical protein I4U23_027616 [Adineta vaga]